MSQRADEDEQVVYIVQASWGGPIKIGTARRGRVTKRLKEIQTGNPSHLVVRKIMPGGWLRERALHSEFAHLRLRGEWFECTDEIRNALDCCWGQEEDGSTLGYDTPGEGEPVYEWQLLSHNYNKFKGRLRLVYEVDGSSLSDEWLPHERSAHELWADWRRWLDASQYDKDEVAIIWSVTSPDVSVFEAAPFTTSFSPRDWLTHYSWPVNSETLLPVMWARIPIEQHHWSESAATKGGFVTQVTGWQPSPLQKSVSVRQLELMCGFRGAYGPYSRMAA